MAIMQTAYRTFESHKHLAGEIVEGQKEALTPISHIIINAQIEIIIDEEGNFRRADALKNEKTIIPVTEKSANRTGNPEAHPLNDQLKYIATYSSEHHASYIKTLSDWANSEYSHPKVRAVLKYIQGGTVIEDLSRSGIIELENGAVKPKYDDNLIRWRVNLGLKDASKSPCWEDMELFACYTDYYKSTLCEKATDLCMITGEEDILCDMHPKGVVSASYGAKLLSANDSGFTYRGRFTKSQQAYNVGYTSSQKAHSALGWIASNEGVMIGGRTFICWNPEGKAVPSDEIFGLPGEKNLDYEHYKKQLLETLSGYKSSLLATDDVVVASLSAATTGRLSVTYYSELKASDFLNRIENWYDTVCWNSAFWGTISPTIKRIATCAFGVERGRFIDADEKILREHVQRLLQCVVGGAAVPSDIVRALAQKAGNPLAYKESKNLETLRTTACAMIRKYRNDKLKREEWKLALDIENEDRSYLFGRLLAVAENVERSTFDREEKRETNAIRMQSVFAQRPLYAWRVIDERLNPYFAKLDPGLRSHYKKIIGEITDKLPTDNKRELERRLDDTYLLGYYHQRSALYKKKETKIEEAIENEHIEK